MSPFASGCTFLLNRNERLGAKKIGGLPQSWWGQVRREGAERDGSLDRPGLGSAEKRGG